MPIHIIIHTLICVVDWWYLVWPLPLSEGRNFSEGVVSSHHAPQAPAISAGSQVWRSEIMKVYTGKGLYVFVEDNVM